MELEWSWSGTGNGMEWNGNGMSVEWQWNGDGMAVGWQWRAWVPNCRVFQVWGVLGVWCSKCRVF